MTPPRSGLREQGFRSATRRMTLFAFTSADLLLEVSPDGVILFAEGAFERYFGKPGQVVLHTRLETLLDPMDRGVIPRIMMVLTSKTRTSPVIVHLANAERSPLALTAMRGDGPNPGVFFTFGQPPVEALDSSRLAITSPSEFAEQVVERMLSATDAPSLAFVEVSDQGSGLQQSDIQKALHQVVPSHAAVGDMAPGRFSILHPELDLVDLERRLVESLHRFGRNAAVSATAISLATGDLPPDKAASILRMMLASFVNEGMSGVSAVSGDKGILGIMDEIKAQSRRIATAIREKSFDLEYQPICDVHTREIHHYEALIRPFDGLPPSYRFVRVAEEAGLSEHLDLAVMEKVSEVARGKTTVAVNISGYSAQKREFQDRFVELAKRHQNNIIVELTETAEIQDRQTGQDFFVALSKSGIPICFDDFGAGAAGLQYLRDFPVDFVKVDGSYVRTALTNPRQRAILLSIVEMAQAVGARTIAEFVETEEQASLVAGMGVTLIQGWLVGKPAPLPTIDGLLRTSGLRR